MTLIQKNTVGILVSLLAGIALFNGLILEPHIGEFIKSNPLVMIGAAVVFVVFNKQITTKIGFIDQPTAQSALYTLAGIFLFNGITHLEQVMPLMKTYSLWLIIIGFALILFRHKIEDIIGG